MVTGEQFDDLWLGPYPCAKDHKLFGGVWCPCSPFLSPEAREAAFWSLDEPTRRLLHARIVYDPEIRAAAEEAEASGRDPVVVEAERGLMTRDELATVLLVATAAAQNDRADPLLIERGEAARKALKAGRHV